MRKWRVPRKAVSLLCASVLMCALVPMQVFAQPSGGSTIGSIAQPLVSAEEQLERLAGATDGLIPLSIDPALYDVPDDVARAKRSAGLPDTFDLRNVEGNNYVTSVKFQNPWGSCWAFAALSGMESNYLRETGEPAVSVDFSERHMAWFYGHALQTTKQKGEGVVFLPTKDDPEGKGLRGAPLAAATAVVSSGQGPAAESEVPYKNEEGKSDNSVFYNEDGDWSVPEEKRFSSLAQLENATVLPPLAIITGEKNDQYEYNPEGAAAVKQALMNTGAVALSYCADMSQPGETGSDGYFNYKTWSQYTDSPKTPNHGVAIVGWDDNYAVDKFKEGVQPPDKGAWIVKNSWGADTPNVFPNKHSWGIGDEGGTGGTGYFYLSYYDQTLREAYSFDLATATGEQYDRTYQYDYLAQGGFDGTMVVPATVNTQVASANVFVAERDQVIKAASVNTIMPGTAVTIEVYRLFENAQNPTEGTLLGTTKETLEYGGYHRVALQGDASAYQIRAGEKFSVVETVVDPEGSRLMSLERGLTEKAAAEIGSDQYYNAVINPGESYIIAGEGWEDAVDLNSDPNLANTDSLPFGNVMIKAFADDVALPPVESKEVSQVTSTVTGMSAETAAKAKVIGALTGGDMSIVLSDLAADSPVPALFAQNLTAHEKMLAVYDMTLQGASLYKGELQVSAPVGDAYNGKLVKMLHFVQAGKLNKQGVVAETDMVDVYTDVPVENGVARIMTYSLSPLGVALSEGSQPQPGPQPEPKPLPPPPLVKTSEATPLAATGDSTTTVSVMTGAVFAVAALVAALTYRARKRKD